MKKEPRKTTQNYKYFKISSTNFVFESYGPKWFGKIFRVVYIFYSFRMNKFEAK